MDLSTESDDGHGCGNTSGHLPDRHPSTDAEEDSKPTVKCEQDDDTSGHLSDTHPNTDFDEDSKPAAQCEEEDNDDANDKEHDPQEDSKPAVECEQNDDTSGAPA